MNLNRVVITGLGAVTALGNDFKIFWQPIVAGKSAAEAIKDSGFDPKTMAPFEIGEIWGTGQGGMETFEEQVTEQHLRFWRT